MGRFLQLALLVAAAVLVVLPSVGSAQPVPTLAPSPAPAAREAPRPRGSLVVAPAPGGELVVRSRPGGGVVARLGERTEFGSPTTLAVVRERGRWLRVVTTLLPNGKIGCGDRIAIHGTNDPSSIGQASSAGCPRASDADLRVLMRRVPLGTPVLVHP